MLKKALAVALCVLMAAVFLVACDEGAREEKDNALRAEIIGVWVPMSYDLTTNNPFLAVLFTETQHYMFSFSGGEPGSRTVTAEEGTEYTIKNGNFIIKTDTLNDSGKMQEYKTAISFPDRDTMIWGKGNGAETYRRITDDEIAFFGIPVEWYNKAYLINENNTDIPRTGGSGTTGGVGSNTFENAVESSLKPFVDYYSTWDYEKTNETLPPEEAVSETTPSEEASQ
jgi:hypothetical protein